MGLKSLVKTFKKHYNIAKGILNMKKFIACFLILILLFLMTPTQVFAQRVADLPPVQDDFYKKKAVGDYKPAMSFEYDYYEVGAISPKKFVASLEEDLLNSEDYTNPEDLKPTPYPGGYNKWGSPEHLRQSYNNFLYYNIYPEESPMWNKTALVPDNGVQEKDVMAILDHHNMLAKYVAERFKYNPKYTDERNERYVRLIPAIIVIAATFYISWEVAPAVVVKAIPCLAGTGIGITILRSIISLATMIGFDALITDQVAWHMVQKDERLKYLTQSVSSYRNSAINISLETDLLKPIKETEYEIISEEIEKVMKSNPDKQTREDIKLIKKLFKGYSGLGKMERFLGKMETAYDKMSEKEKSRLKIVLGKFLYDIFDGDEVLINEYFRKEMLRTYYALLFIEEELDAEYDPLRYDRAIIDLATTYKIQNIQIVDGRMIKRKNESKVLSFGENLQQLNGSCNLGKYENRDFLNYINAEVERQLGAELADQTSVATTYPTMLTRAQVNYLVQLMDIAQKKKDYETKMKNQVETKKSIEKKVSKRVNENLEHNNWSMTK